MTFKVIETLSYEIELPDNKTEEDAEAFFLSLKNPMKSNKVTFTGVLDREVVDLTY